MENIFYIFLFFIWSIFWSFGSVLIYRLKSEESWILTWRSHCAKCNHTLWFFELIPIFSWLKNFWKCKYCKQKISAIYPILEISTWIVFSFVWIFLINFEKIILLDFLEIWKLFFWLSISFITILYIFYDILFTEIHEWIMAIWIFLAFLWIFLNNFFEINSLIFNFSQISNLEIFISSILWLFILWGFYLIMLKELDEIYDILILFLIWISLFFYKIFFPETNFSENFILSWIIWAFWIFIFFFLQYFFSWWKAIWWWDFRIWIMIWLLLGIKFSLLWILLTYIIWSLIWVFILIKNRKTKKSSEIAFWPFLWIWFFIVLFWSESILNFTKNYFHFL